MKKILLSFIVLWSVYQSSAQTTEADKSAALQLVRTNSAALGLSAGDLANIVISSSYIDKSAGNVRLVYLQQTYKGIPVYNQIQALAFKDGKLMANSGRFENVGRANNHATEIPQLTAEAAIRAALTDRGLTSNQPAIFLNIDESSKKLNYSNMGISRENITAQLMWVPSEDKKQIDLGWQIYIAPTTSADLWTVRIDANSGKTLGVTNLTVYCNWGTPEEHNSGDEHAEKFSYSSKTKAFDLNKVLDFKPAEGPNSPNIVNSASYLVIKYPTEAPSFGAASLHTDPWLMAPGNATSYKWHFDGTTNYTITRGNNVWAKEDRLGTNSNAGLPATSTTAPDPLTFNFPPDYTVAPTTPAFQQFAITNLFYWNNVMHDLFYQYGFDEPSANFQADNQGRGGLGNDFVYGDAQDGSGTNNANFGTPADGGNGRMQMYLFTAPNPDRDGDIDNGIVAHEYGHGISHRLTGGPASGAGCLSNSERGDEGWSDYFALMMTTDWSTALITDGFTKPRPMGTYVLNQPTTGAGIRCRKYCTDFAVNNLTYAMVAAGFPCGSSGEVHNIGEIWCATVWDMTWNIITQNGTINPNLFNAAGNGGNSIALKLVIMGEKLQKCSPGFLDSRDAILQADQLLYNGLYHCSIVQAFARRGMGFDAIQGSSNSVTDQTAGFSTEESSLTLTQSVTQQQELLNVTYTNKVSAYCTALNNFTLRDTLPTNVTFVSATNGGTYNAGNRVVSWPVVVAANSSQLYSFTIQINAGTYFAPVTLMNETVPGPGVPAGWAATIGSGPANWTVSSAQSHSAPSSFFAVDFATAGTDFRMSTTAPLALGQPTSKLTFWHNFDTEPGWDGGVVEISTNGGGVWTDLGPYMTDNGYNSSVGAGSNNPIAPRAAFSGNSAGWIQTSVTLLPFANQNAMFRFRMSSDDNTAAVGWYVDDIQVQSIAQVNMRSSLFNSAGTRVSFKDTITLILPATGCTAQTITSHPSNVTTCNGTPASFTVAASGTAPLTYQWQESINGGGSWTTLTNTGIYSGVTTTTLNISAVTLAMSGYQYRAIVNGCGSPINSNAATLTVVALSIGGTVTPANTSVCGTTNTGTLTLSGQTGAVVTWESATVLAGPYTPIPTTAGLTSYTFNNLLVTTYFRVVVQAPGCATATSSVATVTIIPGGLPMTIVADPGTTICAGDPTRLTASETTVGSPPVPVPTISHSTAHTITTGNSVSCGTAVTTSVNSFWRAYNLSTFPVITGPLTITNVTFGIESSTGGPQNVIVNLYDQTGAAFPGGTRTLIKTQTFSVPNTALGSFIATFTTPVTVSNSQTIIVEAQTAGAVGTRFFIGSNASPETAPSYLSATACAINAPTTTAAIGFPNMHIILDLNGTIPGIGPITTGTFLWSPAAGLSSTTTNPVAASPMVTTTYTVTHNNGAGCIRTAQITINVNQRPTVTSNPSNVSLCSGSVATFTVGGTGAGLTYQWQFSTDNGATWNNVPAAPPYTGTQSATLTINPATVAMSGYRYRAVLSGTCPPAIPGTPNISSGAILTVLPSPAVTVTPTVSCGGPGNCNPLTASGANGYTWSPVSGLYLDCALTQPYAGTNTATVYAAPLVNTVYTVTGTNTTTGCTGTATATVNYTPSAPIVTPSGVSMCLGDAAVPLTITSSLAPTTVTFTQNTPLNVPDGPILPNTVFPGVVSTLNISGIPAGAVISAMSVKINATHPFSSDLVIGLKAPNNAILNLDANMGKTGQPGANIVNMIISSASTTSLATATAPYTGTFAPDAVGATYTVNFPPVLTFPGGPTSPPGYNPPTVTNFNGLYSVPNGNWQLAVYDYGNGDQGQIDNWSVTITYGSPSVGIWTPNGAGSGLYTDPAATITYTGTPAQTVYVRPLITTVYAVTVSTGTCTSAPRLVPVTVNTPINITSQPVNATVCTDKTISFSVTASGTAPTYQWQESTNSGGTFNNLSDGGVYSGTASPTLTLTAPPVSMNGYVYRVIVGGSAPCGSVTSAARTLTVNPLPTVVITPAPYRNIFPGLTTTLSSTSTPAAATYTWFRNGVVIGGATTGSYVVDVDHLGTYTLRVTDINGCVGTSNAVTIGDSLSGRVFIYPNPNSGRFQVRYNPMHNAITPYGLKVFDAMGKLVLNQKYTLGLPYSPMYVDLSNMGTGVYWVEVVDIDDQRLAMGRVEILR